MIARILADQAIAGHVHNIYDNRLSLKNKSNTFHLLKSWRVLINPQCVSFGIIMAFVFQKTFSD